VKQIHCAAFVGALMIGSAFVALPSVAGASPSGSSAVAHAGEQGDGRGDDHGREEILGHVGNLAPNQAHTVGFYRGHRIEYLDLGPVQLAPGNDVDPIWVVTNGTADQRNILDVVPGDPAGYTPLWQVTKVTWKAGVRPRTLTSAKAVAKAAARGWVTIETTDVVVNCPILGFDQPLTHGFLKGHDVAYYDLGPLLLAPGNDIDPIWVVTNGTADQANVIDNAPPAADYTPLWGVVTVTWHAGVAPRTLTSADAVSQAEAAGEVTLATTSIVVNCPVV
jgi:hypothetical protein